MIESLFPLKRLPKPGIRITGRLAGTVFGGFPSASARLSWDTNHRTPCRDGFRRFPFGVRSSFLGYESQDALPGRFSEVSLRRPLVFPGIRITGRLAGTVFGGFPSASARLSWDTNHRTPCRDGFRRFPFGVRSSFLGYESQDALPGRFSEVSLRRPLVFPDKRIP
ncbi:hypothetical protein MTO96_030789 [Rhipicephalus appendiculatus]